MNSHYSKNHTCPLTWNYQGGIEPSYLYRLTCCRMPLIMHALRYIYDDRRTTRPTGYGSPVLAEKYGMTNKMFVNNRIRYNGRARMKTVPKEADDIQSMALRPLTWFSILQKMLPSGLALGQRKAMRLLLDRENSL
jgi:hypothetical protein